MKKILFAIYLLILFCPAILMADKGLFWWTMDAELSQDSQKAIILHNFKEEVLILGTELKASKDTGILEFIPFPSEPEISLAKGNPFEEINKLLQKKRIEFAVFTKGGSSAEPVEIRLSQKIGLHDVTVIKINDINGFNKGSVKFFMCKIEKEIKEGVFSIYHEKTIAKKGGIHP